MSASGFDIGEVPGYVAAVGALGIAAFGVVEALGKSLFVWARRGQRRALGLPYVGFDKVDDLLRLVHPAMKASYGGDYRRIMLQQYRAGRSKGQAPETIRQGVRLGLPFVSHTAAIDVISALWGLPPASAELLAGALAGPPAGSPPLSPADTAAAQALAARFATALDTRVQAAFEVAEQAYQAQAQLWAGLVAIFLSLGYQAAYTNWNNPSEVLSHAAIGLLVGLVAVPLAPAAKDLSSALSDALAALGKIRGGGK